MANEANIIELYGFDKGRPLNYTVADDTNISAGTLGNLIDPRTVLKGAKDNEFFAGIAVSDKEAGDGSTTLGFYTTGLFDLVAEQQGAAISAGQLVKMSGANFIHLADDSTIEEAGQIVGLAMEDKASNVEETIVVDIGVR